MKNYTTNQVKKYVDICAQLAFVATQQDIVLGELFNRTEDEIMKERRELFKQASEVPEEIRGVGFNHFYSFLEKSLENP